MVLSKRFSASLFAALILTSCAAGPSAADKANEIVCQDIAGFMEGSGYMEGSRESLLKAVIKISMYTPAAVEDWITYMSPLDGDYVPSLYDNDNAVYQSLYRLQEQAIDYTYTKNSGAYYGEWKYFLKFCGLDTKE